MSNAKQDLRPDYIPSEVTIKEMMLVKNCSRQKAINILRNPTEDKNKDTEKTDTKK